MVPLDAYSADEHLSLSETLTRLIIESLSVWVIMMHSQNTESKSRVGST